MFTTLDTPTYNFKNDTERLSEALISKSSRRILNALLDDATELKVGYEYRETFGPAELVITASNDKHERVRIQVLNESKKEVYYHDLYIPLGDKIILIL
jgi:hypothetical protein